MKKKAIKYTYMLNDRIDNLVLIYFHFKTTPKQKEKKKRKKESKRNIVATCRFSVSQDNNIKNNRKTKARTRTTLTATKNLINK